MKINTKYITIVAGARPNFMKVAPIIHKIIEASAIGVNIDYHLVHTGQHYDKNMSGSFFDQLDIPEPTINLGCKGSTHSEQTAEIMCKFETFLLNNKSNLVLVVGDVNSTLACSIVAQKLCIKVAHIEAGIRSNDWKMPEEINRLVTDSITNYFFTTSRTANNNLINSGVSEEKIFFVGNTMIDTLIKHKPDFKKPLCWDIHKLVSNKYAVLTLHRPANVDNLSDLQDILNSILYNFKEFPIIFPVHPRTKKILSNLSLNHDSLHYIDPLPYLEFNYLVKNAKVVLTDSGGITEETTVLGVPCMTLRNNTERPETIKEGTNILIGTDPTKFQPYFKKLFNGSWKKGNVPELWDGKTADRIVNEIIKIFSL